MMCKGKTVGARWIFSVMGCLGFVWIYALRVNLSVALMAMVNHTAVLSEVDLVHQTPNASGSDVAPEPSTGVTSESVCNEGSAADSEKKELEDGPFIWNSNIQGLVLGSYFYGYIFTQMPGGWLAEKYSAKHIFGVCTLINAILAILSPVAAKASYIALVIVRILMGLAAGTLVPTMHVLIASWAPPNERSKISSIIYAGTTLGTLFCLPISGLLAASLGWESVFYVQGALTVVWYLLWLVLVYENPDVHPRIDKEEQTMIVQAIAELGGSKTSEGKMEVPWKDLMTSMAVWAIIVAHTCSNWGWYMLLVKLPTYMRYILQFDIKSNALLSALPYLCMWIFIMVLATTLDALRSRKIISTGGARKLATAVGSVPVGVLLILVTYVGCNTTLAVALLTLAAMVGGGKVPGYLSNHIDIAPPYAGILMGISNTFATIPGILVPSFIGYMTHNNQTVEAWRKVFLVTFGIYCLEFLFFTIFAKGDQQEWAKTKRPSDEAVDLAHFKERKLGLLRGYSSRHHHRHTTHVFH